jgi:YVTN family beta-propeller protein
MSITATTVTLGTNLQGLAINPITNLLYIADYGAAVVYVLDAGNNYNLVATIPVGLQPYSVAIALATNTIYVANQNITAPPNVLGTLSIIDGNTNTVTATITLPDIPNQVVVNSANGDVYTGGSNLTRIVNGAIVESIVYGPSSITGLVVNPVANQLYLIYLGAMFKFWLQRVALPDMAFIDQVTTAINGNGVGTNPETDTIYSTALQGGITQVWNGNTSPPSPVANVTNGGYPERVAVNLNSGNYYTCNYWNDTVTIASAANDVLDNVAVGQKPWDIAVNLNTGIVYTANFWNTFSYFTDTTS